ncbi:hypothetical protein GOHSU_71_00030 [Gordonia hirsuta DSM 44140 = NBRC 16056]|uniref:Uncharacterized protein n=1 Tax=Gordonia hirsuta DSM 44140 = NBRC 16056 TaxID=1121927 RepID=L7LD35_9ACTN|nr:hypothetical protein [Gordonia hirsuta]GAC59030.1 hypothetical protein GOHSU_71_00030 [Gordonia hirsuta DSM 44140 = NBRC 16056]
MRVLRNLRRRPALLITLIVALSATLLGTAAPAAAAPVPAELQFSRFSPVNPAKYQSVRWADNGRSYFVAGRWQCQLGPQPGSVACKGRPATAPPNTRGVAITNDLQGPLWVPPGTTYRFGSEAGFRAPVLKVGQRIQVADAVCAVPRAGVVSCATNNRAFILSRAWHKFYYPKGDRRHSANPAPKYLPARLR